METWNGNPDIKMETWSGRRNWHLQHNSCRLLYKEIRHEVVAKVLPKCIVSLSPRYLNRGQRFTLDNEDVEYVNPQRESYERLRLMFWKTRGVWMPKKSFNPGRRTVLGPKSIEAYYYLEPLVGEDVYKWVYLGDSPRCPCNYRVRATAWTAFLKQWGYHHPILY